MGIILDFEKPIIDLENKIKELKNFTKKENIDLTSEISKLTLRLRALRKEIFGNLSNWQKIQISRHSDRPYTLDYINFIASDFIELHGDRCFGDDKALITGLATIDGFKVMIMGHQKGRDMKENLERNFGCAHPEGYRKAMRFMRMAEKYNIPIISFIDTPGAYPGIGAEERGQAEAIAYNLREMASISVPILGFVIGEGGSGGALGIGITDKVFVLENAYYSVISPEGCAAILWREPGKASLATNALKITAKELLELKLIDGIVSEPLGGAHRNPKLVAMNLKKILLKNLKELLELSKKKLVDNRYNRYRNIGFYKE